MVCYLDITTTHHSPFFVIVCKTHSFCISMHVYIVEPHDASFTQCMHFHLPSHKKEMMVGRCGFCGCVSDGRQTCAMCGMTYCGVVPMPIGSAIHQSPHVGTMHHDDPAINQMNIALHNEQHMEVVAHMFFKKMSFSYFFVSVFMVGVIHGATFWVMMMLLW
jgi:hypothetical protein